MDRVLDLLAHSEWADADVFGRWAACPAREADDLRRLAAHMRDVRRGFTSMLSGGPPVWPPSELPAFEELRADTAATHAALRAFAAKLTPEAAAATVRIPWFPDPPCVVTVAEGLLQVALHTQHHRGQLMTKLRAHGGAPENVDYVIWLWQRRPAARW